jgi:hypothetical protein
MVDLAMVDLAMGGDLAGGDLTIADLAGADLAAADFTLLGDGGLAHQYVIRRLLMPPDHTTYALDLNGDGKPDNQFGNIEGALAAQNLDPQQLVDSAVNGGRALDLVQLDTSDPALQNDPQATATLQAAQPMANPGFNGAGTFTVDAAQPPGQFPGGLSGALFSSPDPVTTKQPVSWTLSLPLIVGATPVRLPLHGVHLQFQTGTDAPSGAPGLLAGQINGSVPSTALQIVVIPEIAASLNAEVQANPGSAVAMQILQIFDTNGDGMISTAEVAQNAIIQNLLAPDVQIYDAMGNYAPNPANTNKDSLSVGIGFLAVKASF